MSVILSHYKNLMQEQKACPPWLSELKHTGLSQFESMGFPQGEEWKYTKVDPLLKHSFTLPQALDTLEENIRPEYETALPPVIVRDGQVMALDAIRAQLPEGIYIDSIANAIETHPDLIQPYLSQILKPTHGFHALNTAMLQQGVFIHVASGLRLLHPIVILHEQQHEGQVAFIRHLLVAEGNSHIELIEDYYGRPSLCYFTNTITEIHLAKDAHVTHYKLLRESDSAFHVGQLAVQQMGNNRFETHMVSFGGKWVRNDVAISLEEAHSQCVLNGIYKPNEASHIDHHTEVHHIALSCKSEQDYKGIMPANAHGVFNGKVIVNPGAVHTVAYQKNKNLLLAKNAQIDTKPQLEIYADDVQCTHGATVGHVDDEALFYLESRGISKEEASLFLVKAFTAENVARLPYKPLAQWLEAIL